MKRSRRGGGLQIAIRSHPPERRRRQGNVAACCCCSCCCCLHSLGGLIGSAVAGRSKTLEEHGATVTYWLCLLAAILLTCGAGPLMFGEGLAGLLAALIFLPALQLVVSVIGAVIVACTTGTAGLRRIWTITWRGFVGALAGVGI